MNVQQQPYGIKKCKGTLKRLIKVFFQSSIFITFVVSSSLKNIKASIFFLILCRNHIAVHQCEIMSLKVFSHIWICYGTVNGEIC